MANPENFYFACPWCNSTRIWPKPNTLAWQVWLETHRLTCSDCRMQFADAALKEAD
jgi:hypothetical protein